MQSRTIRQALGSRVGCFGCLEYKRRVNELGVSYRFRKMNFLRVENMPRNLVRDFQFILAYGIILSQHCSSPRFLDALPQAVQGAGPVS